MKQEWEIKKLSEVCLINPKKNEVRSKLNDKDLVSFLPMIDLGIMDKNIFPKQQKKLSEVYKGYTYFAEHDVLLAKVTPCFENGKLGIANYLTNGIGFGSSEYIVLRSLGDLLPEYLFYFLSTEKFREEGAKLMFGACGLKRLSKDYVDNTLIKYPLLSEQQRIVEILDEAFSKIDTVKQNAERNLKNAKELFQSVLKNELAKKANWKIDLLSNCFKLISGEYLSSKMMVSGKYPVYGGNGIAGTHNEFNLSGLNVIVGRVGALCGNVRCLENQIWLTDNGFKITDLKYDFDLFFLTYQLNYIELRKYARQAAQPVISNSSLKDVRIFIPPLSEQQQIVSKLDALSEKCKTLENNYLQTIKDCDELKKAILTKAFNGEL